MILDFSIPGRQKLWTGQWLYLNCFLLQYCTAVQHLHCPEEKVFFFNITPIISIRITKPRHTLVIRLQA